MSIKTQAAPSIARTRSTAFPQFHFEWHEQAGKVYLINVPGVWEQGMFYPDIMAHTADAECIAEHVDTHGRFLGFVQTYLRGYRKGESKHV